MGQLCIDTWVRRWIGIGRRILLRMRHLVRTTALQAVIKGDLYLIDEADQRVLSVFKRDGDVIAT